MSKERLLYILICTFTVISCFTEILDALYLKLPSKIIQVVIVFICFILVLTNKNRTSLHRGRIVCLTLVIILLEFFLLFKDIWFSKANLFITFQSFLQIFFIYYWIFIAFNIKDSLLNKIIAFLEKLFIYGCVFALVEFLMPESIKMSLLRAIAGQNVISYLSRDIVFFSMRLGSFYLSPLTFSFTLLFLIANNINNRKKSIIYFVLAFISQTKTAMFGGLFVLVGGRYRMLNMCGMVSLLGVVAALCYFFDGDFFYFTFDGTSLKSLSNHLAGLVYGIQSSFDNIWGNGLGSSGFLAIINGGGGAFVNTVLELGNESTIGVIAYQLGCIFMLLHIFLFVYMFSYQIKQKNFSAASFILLMLAFQVFSESSLTLLITFSQAFLFAKTLKMSNNENSNN